MLKKVAIASAGALLTILPQVASAQSNLFQDPGFEVNGGDGSQTASPWQFSQGSQVGVNAANAHTGSAFARLTFLLPNGSAFGSLSQSVTATQGGLYDLSFDYAGFGSVFSDYNVQINGINVGFVSSRGLPQNTYSLFDTSVALLAGTNTFSLAEIPNGSVSQGGQFVVDDFSLTSLSPIAAAVPEPETWAMMIVGFGLAGFALSRRRVITARVSYASDPWQRRMEGSRQP